MKNGEYINRDELREKFERIRHQSRNAGYRHGIEAAMEQVWEEIKEKTHDDFIKLCKDEDPDNEEVIRELWNCRNELCLRCGKYEKAYCGACDDCRYNSENMKRWRKDPDEIH